MSFGQERWSPARLGELGEKAGLLAEQEEESRLPYETDFGRLVRGVPAAVSRPRDVAELERLVGFAYQHGLKLTLRGQGFSQGGQSVAAGSLAVDLRSLAGVDPPDVDTQSIECEAGATFRQVVERSATRGLVPLVLPNNLDLTVGGVLAVGGIGASSYRHGLVVSTVLEMEALTGQGQRHRVSPLQNPELFYALLAGAGRCGVMVRAKLKLRPFAPRLRTFYLLYENVEPWLEDQRRLAEGKPDAPPPCALEAFTTSAAMGLRNRGEHRQPFGVWFYGLQVSWEHAPGAAPAWEGCLRGLRPHRLVHSEDLETPAFWRRYEPRFQAMRTSGAWALPHPWVEAFLPLAKVGELLPPLLDELPLALGDGHRLMLIADENLPPGIALPAERPLAAFALLPAGVPPPLLNELLVALRHAHQRLVAAGGKRYLSGWLGMMTEESWREHFGPLYPAWRAAKTRFDPRGVFSSSLFPATDNPGGSTP